MTRAERAAEVARLLNGGLNGLQIAKRLGLSRSYTYALIKDPTGEADRERKASYGRPCIEGCGRLTNGSDGRANAPQRCLQCERHRNDERNARILEAWGHGETGGQIAAREGLTYDQVRGVVDHRRNRKGEPVPLHRHRDHELWPLIERRWNEGASLKQIAAEGDTSPESIGFMMQTMRQAGVDLPRRRTYLTPHVRRRAVQLYAEGQPSTVVAEALGLSAKWVVKLARDAGVRPHRRGRRKAAA